MRRPDLLLIPCLLVLLHLPAQGQFPTQKEVRVEGIDGRSFPGFIVGIKSDASVVVERKTDLRYVTIPFATLSKATLQAVESWKRDWEASAIKIQSPDGRSFLAKFIHVEQGTAILDKIDDGRVNVKREMMDAASWQRILDAEKAQKEAIAQRIAQEKLAIAATKAAVDQERQKLPAALQAAYFWKSPLIGEVPDVPAEGVEITGSGADGKAGNKLRGQVPFAMNPAKMGPSGPEIIHPVDLPGSKNIKIVIDPQAGATRYAGLVFRTPCEVEIRKDGILLVSDPTLSVTDENGKVWTARPVTIEQKQANVLFAAIPP